MLKTIIMLRIILLLQLLFICQIYGNKFCKYSRTLSGRATLHPYKAHTSMNEVACQLPMAFNRKNGKLRVTAINRFQGMKKGLVCGDCIRVRNIHSKKSTVVMVIDFGGAGGLDLCPDAFNDIDTDDKMGHFRGHMNVEWEKTTCDDLIGDQRIKYRYKAGSGKNWYMGVSIIDQRIPLSRTNAVQISDREHDPNSWYKCNANGANGYWFCTGHPRFREDMPFFFRIESIDGQVLIDKINKVEGSNEGRFIKSVRRIQFIECNNHNQIDQNSTQTSGGYPRPLSSTRRPLQVVTTPTTTTTTTQATVESTSTLCRKHNCNNCLWDFGYGAACFAGWTSWHCRVQGGPGYWCGNDRYSEIFDKILSQILNTNCGIGNKYCI